MAVCAVSVGVSSRSGLQGVPVVITIAVIASAAVTAAIAVGSLIALLVRRRRNRLPRIPKRAFDAGKVIELDSESPGLDSQRKLGEGLGEADRADDDCESPHACHAYGGLDGATVEVDVGIHGGRCGSGDCAPAVRSSPAEAARAYAEVCPDRLLQNWLLQSVLSVWQCMWCQLPHALGAYTAAQRHIGL